MRLCWFGSVAICGLVLMGCEKQPAEFPLAVGNTWTYTVRPKFIEYPGTVEVKRELSVAGTKGYELAGPLGTSRVAWKDGVLYADALVNSTFNPALPILLGGKTDGSVDWEGTMTVLGNQRQARATLSQREDKVTLGGREIATTRATLLLEVKGHEVELITWYAPGVGPVKQEQRTDDRQIVNLELVSGP